MVIAVLANDSVLSGITRAVTAVSDPARGSAAINPDGTVTYTPDPDFNGSDSFTYTVSYYQSFTTTSTATVTATVNPVTDVSVSEIITPVSATFDDDVAPIVTAFNPPERLIDGSGLSGVGPILSQTAEGGWWGPNNEGNGEDGANFKAPGGNVLWFGVQPIAEWPPLEFDLIDVVGTYSITYTATDVSGNVSAPVSRTVNVVDPTPPRLTASLNPVRAGRHDDDDEEGDDDDEGGNLYRVAVAATDACDPAPAVSAYISQPLSSSSSFTVVYKKAKKNRFHIEQDRRSSLCRAAFIQPLADRSGPETTSKL